MILLNLCFSAVHLDRCYCNRMIYRVKIRGDLISEEGLDSWLDLSGHVYSHRLTRHSLHTHSHSTLPAVSL